MSSRYTLRDTTSRLLGPGSLAVPKRAKKQATRKQKIKKPIRKLVVKLKVKQEVLEKMEEERLAYLKKMEEERLWYEKHYAISARIDEAQAAASTAYQQWSRRAQGEMPAPAQVDDLQVEFFEHIETAPDDEPDDEVEAKLRSERFALEHRNDMGYDDAYHIPLRHTQTMQYHDELSNIDKLRRREGRVDHDIMAPAFPGMLPPYPNQHRRSPEEEALARERTRNALAAYATKYPDEELTATAADRARLLDVDETMEEGVEQVRGARSRWKLRQRSPQRTTRLIAILRCSTKSMGIHFPKHIAATKDHTKIGSLTPRTAGIAHEMPFSTNGVREDRGL